MPSPTAASSSCPADASFHVKPASAAPEPPPGAASYLGDRFEVMRRYVDHLAGTAIDYGLIGPREREVIWTRHVLNCGVLGELIEQGAELVDVGSGAGLPGLVVAIARPDLRVTLVEPLLRRSTWLSDVVDDLGVTNVVVRRDRAEAITDLHADVVTSRAVARLDKLAGWSAPLVRPGGRIIAIKGESAAQELAESRTALARLGVVDGRVEHCGVGVIDPPTTVVELTVRRPAPGPAAEPAARDAQRARRRGRRRGPERQAG